MPDPHPLGVFIETCVPGQVDYRGDEVSVENFLRLLTGEIDASAWCSGLCLLALYRFTIHAALGVYVTCIELCMLIPYSSITTPTLVASPWPAIN